MRIYRIRKFPTKLVILVLVVSIVTLNPTIRIAVKNFTFEILIKPFKFFSKIKTYFVSKKNLLNESIYLKERLAHLSIELARTESLARENKRLKSIIDFKKTLPSKTIVAKVIGRDSVGWRRSLIIDKGSSDGIKEHMSCATSKGLVGSILDVGKHSSKVMLITDPGSRVGVIIDPSRESGILTGSPKGDCKVIYLSLDALLEKGDRVITAGFSSFFPKGIPIGKIKKIEIEKNKLYKYASVDTYENMNQIEEVVCIYAD